MSQTPTQSSRKMKPQPVCARWAIPAITPIGANAPVSETLPRAVRRIAATLKPQKIILFGSYAYGTPTPDSDVDLLIVMQTNGPHKERSWAVSRLLIPRPFPVDILVRTPVEITQALKGRNYFMQEVVSRGRVLYARR